MVGNAKYSHISISVLEPVLFPSKVFFYEISLIGVSSLYTLHSLFFLCLFKMNEIMVAAIAIIIDIFKVIILDPVTLKPTSELPLDSILR